MSSIQPNVGIINLDRQLHRTHLVPKLETTADRGMRKDDESIFLLIYSRSFPGNQHIYHSLDKSTVLQEARVFNESPIKPQKCCSTLAKVLYLIYQGQEFQRKEATDLFFSVTKLFQSKDVRVVVVEM